MEESGILVEGSVVVVVKVQIVVEGGRKMIDVRGDVTERGRERNVVKRREVE